MMIYNLHLQRSYLLTRRKLGLIMCRERFTFMGQSTLHPFQVLKMCFCSNRSQFMLLVLETFKELLCKHFFISISKYLKKLQSIDSSTLRKREIIFLKKEKPGILDEKKA